MSSTDPNALAEPMGSLIRYGLVLARKKGKSLSLTSGLRTRQQQIDLRRAHCGTSNYQIFEAPSSACRPYTARPGTSKHETGQAADMSGSKDWLAGQLRPFDVERRVPGENWHFQYYGSNPAATMALLDRTMTAERFTPAERAEVAGTGSGGAGGLAFGGNGVSWGDTSGGGGGSGGLGAIASLAGSITRPITDGDFRKRIGLFLAGVLLFYGASQLLARDLLKEALNG